MRTCRTSEIYVIADSTSDGGLAPKKWSKAARFFSTKFPIIPVGLSRTQIL